MKNLTFYLTFCFLSSLFAASLSANQSVSSETNVSLFSAESEAQVIFQYFLDEVTQDDTLSHEEQHNKFQEFKMVVSKLHPEVASALKNLLLEETHSRIIDMLYHAEFDREEIDSFLDGYEKTLLDKENISVEFARQMLFFVAELKIHKQYVYDFGVALGCSEKQLLRHDLCKLDPDQFEGYVRYFRGGRKEEDKQGYLAAWELHQFEEHHHQSYSKEGFNFADFSEERLKNNMLETVADLLAANKQRGGATLINYLTDILPKHRPHQRLLPYLVAGLKKAHAFYLDSEENPNSEYTLFQGLPCWNSEVEAVFIKMDKEEAASMISPELFEELQSPLDLLNSI